MTKPIYDLYAISKQQSRPATEEERQIAKGYFHPGDPSKNGLLLIHGFTSTGQALAELADAAKAQGHSVSLMCLPGHGSSAEQLNSVSYKDWRTAVANAHQQLKQHCKKVYCLGFSLGASLAVQLAAEQPDIEHLFLLCPAIYPPTLLKYTSPLLKLMKVFGLSYIWQIAGDCRDPAAMILSYRRTSIHGILEFLSALRSAQGVLQTITTATTIIAAKSDSLFKESHINNIVMQLGSNLTHTEILKNSGHEATVDYDKRQIVDVVLKGLKN